MNRKKWLKIALIAIVWLSTVVCDIGFGTPTPTTKPTPKLPVFTVAPKVIPPQPSGPAYAMIESNPPGAQVEVGIKSVGGVVQPGSGRKVGVTPVKVELKQSDVVMTGNNGNIYIELRKTGYFDSMFVLGLGAGGKLEPGKVYPVFIKMNQ